MLAREVDGKTNHNSDDGDHGRPGCSQVQRKPANEGGRCSWLFCNSHTHALVEDGQDASRARNRLLSDQRPAEPIERGGQATETDYGLKLYGRPQLRGFKKRETANYASSRVTPKRKPRRYTLTGNRQCLLRAPCRCRRVLFSCYSGLSPCFRPLLLPLLPA